MILSNENNSNYIIENNNIKATINKDNNEKLNSNNIRSNSFSTNETLENDYFSDEDIDFNHDFFPKNKNTFKFTDFLVDNWELKIEMYFSKINLQLLNIKKNNTNFKCKNNNNNFDQK